MAEEICNPPTVIDEANHGGELEADGSYCSVSDSNVLVSAWKRAEDSDAQILRLVECKGEEKTVSVTVEGREYRTQISPYEIKTLMIENGKIETVDLLEE
jgi:alpha-mannosidase